MKRQRGRNRNGGSSGGNVGGKPQQQNANRAFDSNGPENIKVRGNAQHVFEKYQQLARDATTGGDRVLAENYLQHAEHYFRVVRAMQPTRPASEILGRDQFVSGFDIDFEDESGAQAAAQADADAAAAGYQPEVPEPEPEVRDRNGWRDDRPREDRYQNDRSQSDRSQNDRNQSDRNQGDRPRFRDRDDRYERSRDDRPRDDRPRDDRNQGQSQDRNQGNSDRSQPRNQERPRDDRSVDDRPRGENGSGRRDRWRERDDRPREDRPREDRAERDPLAVIEPQAAPLVAVVEKPSPVLRDDDGGESHAPAFLKAPRTRAAKPPVETGESSVIADEAAKPARRRRTPKSFEGAPESEEA